MNFRRALIFAFAIFSLICASCSDMTQDAPFVLPIVGGATSGGGYGQRVNINTATAAELQMLHGIGERIAQRIIAYREANGPFETIEELTGVSGIGRKKLEAIADAICV